VGQLGNLAVLAFVASMSALFTRLPRGFRRWEGYLGLVACAVVVYFLATGVVPLPYGT